MRRFALLLMFFCLAFHLSAQNKALSHDVYDGWKTMKSILIGCDGRLSAWEENPQRGDGHLIIFDNSNGQHDTIARAASPLMPSSGSFVAMRIKPEFEVIRQLKIKKKKEEDFPKDTAAFWFPDRDSLWVFAPIKQLSVPSRGADVAVILFDKEKPIASKSDSIALDSIANDSLLADSSQADSILAAQPAESKRKYDGTRLALLWPLTGDSICFPNIKDFAISPNGEMLLLISNWNDSLDSTEVVLFNIKDRTLVLNYVNAGKSMSPVLCENGSAAAWLWTPDTAKTKTWRLMFVETAKTNVVQLTDTVNVILKQGFTVSNNKQPWFSRDNRKLYFGIAPRPEQDAEDTIPDDEKLNLDLWSWTDTRLQSQQLKELKADNDYAALCVYNIKAGNMFMLGNDKIRDVRTQQFGNNRFSLGVDETPYLLEQSWTASGLADFYLIDSDLGTSHLLKKGIADPVSLSPDGRWLVWYQRSDSAWFVLDTKLKTERNLTASLNGIFWDDEDDTPSLPGPHGMAGWALNGPYALINDKYNVWLIDVSGKEKAVNLTSSPNSTTNQLVFRYVRTDPDEPLVDLRQALLFKTFDRISKDAGFTRIWLRGHRRDVLINGPWQFDFIAKAKKSDTFLIRKSNYNLYPDLWISDNEFGEAHQISDVNPQMRQYSWGKVQLVNYTGLDGIARQGLLYTPDILLAGEKYPMIVYFYEKYSDDLNAFYSPGPSRSVISFPMYASNGYVVFIPDISYRTGHPGQSGFDCIMGGVNDVLKQFPFIDSTRMGLQGQSWGGYQVAWMVTKTNRFKAAMAGAAVTNMTSAYGGIRWESGMVRQFQYEQSQSRIGQTLWEAPELYIENSPLFFADNVSTPLLMMNNDNDGAVPWYQGIEFYTALRRLNKPVWMLVYNNDDHNLMKWPNRVDLSIRMLQFFDYYLKGQLMPPWMMQGIPAIDKGENAGY